MANSAHAAAKARRQFTVLTGPKNFINDLGEMTRLAGQVIKMAFRGPYDYWGESREIMFQAGQQSVIRKLRHEYTRQTTPKKD